LLWVTRFPAEDEVHALANALQKRQWQPAAVAKSDAAFP
jgi:hypothetical protein